MKKSFLSLMVILIAICTLPKNGASQSMTDKLVISSNAPNLELKNHYNGSLANVRALETVQKPALPPFPLELDSLGEIHNAALAYSYNRLKNMDPTSLTPGSIPEVVSSLTAEYFTNRYGPSYNFSEKDLKAEILTTGITPPPIEDLPVSDQLKNTFTEISRCLTNLREEETSADLNTRVSQIVNTASVNLTENEKLYVKAYGQGITKSFEYWEQNAYAWTSLGGNQASIKLKSQGSSGKASIQMVSIPAEPKKRHPCTASIVNADVAGVIRGAIAGCIAGAIFGVGVGCIPAAIFSGGVSGASGSLGAAIACLVIQQTQN